jgi:hypothetical protein
MKTCTFINAAVLAVTLSAAIQASAALKTCEDEIKETNTFLSEQGVAPINDVTDLATTLRNIKNFGRLPDRYITTDEAKRLGWSGKETETLWGLNPPTKSGLAAIATPTRLCPQSSCGSARILMFRRVIAALSA